MSSPTYYDAILELVPNAKVGVNIKGDKITINWQDERKQPTHEAIQVKLKELQAEYDAQEYARNRSSEYPTWQEQMDMQYWDAKNGTKKWQEAIEAVKTKYPKGGDARVLKLKVRSFNRQR